MQDWDQLARRFQLLKFEPLSEPEIHSYSWNQEQIASIIHETIENVEKYLHFQHLNITIVPALPFPWFQKYDQSLWTNGYAVGATTIVLAIPPDPDPFFLRYMLAHEMHHAFPENPIYYLTLDTFTLADWYKMEGGAEYFSLSLYDDKRWWKDDFTEEAEQAYQEIAQKNIGTTNDRLKSKMCFEIRRWGSLYLRAMLLLIEWSGSMLNSSKSVIIRTYIEQIRSTSLMLISRNRRGGHLQWIQNFLTFLMMTENKSAWHHAQKYIQKATGMKPSTAGLSARKMIETLFIFRIAARTKRIIRIFWT
jgi:hypothetical protein